MWGAGTGMPDGPDAKGGTGQTHRPAPPARLKIRPDFVRASSGGRVHGRCLSLQVYRRKADDRAVSGSRVGLTVTKKVGNSVERNRVKRRFREALRVPDLAVLPDHDYVIVARRDALSASFAGLVNELRRCLVDAAKERPRGAGQRRRPGPSRKDDGGRFAPSP